ERVPGPSAIKHAGRKMTLEQSEISLERGDPGGLDFVRNAPLGSVVSGASDIIAESRHTIGRGRPQRADTSERGFPRRNPVIQQNLMVEQEGRHAEPGRIANAQMPTDGLAEPRRG